MQDRVAGFQQNEKIVKAFEIEGNKLKVRLPEVNQKKQNYLFGAFKQKNFSMNNSPRDTGQSGRNQPQVMSGLRHVENVKQQKNQ